MDISVHDEDSRLTRVVLVGRLDIKGAEKVDLPLSTLSRAKDNLLIDMSGVSFLASIGIRHLVTATKTRERTLRMESIEYSIWVTANGQRKRLFEFEIAITGEDAGRPRVQLPRDKIWVNPEPSLQDFAERIDMDDIHERFDRELAEMMEDGRPQ